MYKLLLKLKRLARLTFYFRYLFLTLSTCSLVLVAYSLLIDSAFTANTLEPAIVASLWGLMIIAFTKLFLNIPDPVLPRESFPHRLLAHLKIFLYSLLALLIMLIFALLTWMSTRLLLL